MIYFLQSPDGGPVKIGYTIDVERRHRELEKHYGVPLAVLAVMEGGADEEAAIHARFDDIRLSGTGRRGARPEQFKPSAELMAFIGKPLLVGANPDAVELMASTRATHNEATIKVSRKIAGMIKVIAAWRGITVAELVTEVIEAPISKMYAQTLRDLD